MCVCSCLPALAAGKLNKPGNQRRLLLLLLYSAGAWARKGACGISSMAVYAVKHA